MCPALGRQLPVLVEPLVEGGVPGRRVPAELEPAGLDHHEDVVDARRDSPCSQRAITDRACPTSASSSWVRPAGGGPPGSDRRHARPELTSGHVREKGPRRRIRGQPLGIALSNPTRAYTHLRNATHIWYKDTHIGGWRRFPWRHRSTRIGDFYAEVVLPALAARLDAVFPEFGWKQDARGWVPTNQEMTHCVLGVRADRGSRTAAARPCFWTSYVNGGDVPCGETFRLSCAN